MKIRTCYLRLRVYSGVYIPFDMYTRTRWTCTCILYGVCYTNTYIREGWGGLLHLGYFMSWAMNNYTFFFWEKIYMPKMRNYPYVIPYSSFRSEDIYIYIYGINIDNKYVSGTNVLFFL